MSEKAHLDWGFRGESTAMQDQVNQYFELLLSKKIISTKHTEVKENNDLEKIKYALEKAHDIRKFEIELFWKRATYFWAFIAILIVCYGTILNLFTKLSPQPAFTYQMLAYSFTSLPSVHLLFYTSILIAMLGLAVSYIWLLAIKSSKFWQNNHEHHIDMLEFYISGNLHKILYVKGEPSLLSVSKLSQAVAILCMIAWGFVVLVSVLLFYLGSQDHNTTLFILAAILALCCSGYKTLHKFTKSSSFNEAKGYLAP